MPRVNSALPVLVRGIVRVSGSSGVGDGSDFTLGLPVIPRTTSSGIVGQTGATGVGPFWMTAAYVAASGATSVAAGAAGGVARLVKIHVTGTSTQPTGEWDIMLMPQRPDFA